VSGNSPLDILSNKKVLYAEDEEGIRENIAEVLEMFFEHVTAVSDGREALDEMSLGNYDVLIFDICMPHMDGLDAIKSIREEDAKIPIIVLSAHTEKEYLWRAVELKITKYLIKPYDEAALLGALERAALELVDRHVDTVFANGCTYRADDKTVTRDKTVLQLSKHESRLLEFLIARKDQAVTFEHIYDYMWEYEQPSKEAIKSIIKELRKKIGVECIKNIYGIGYRIALQ